MSNIRQIMAECDCQHEACATRGYCMAARIDKLEAGLLRIDDLNRTQPDEDGVTWAVSDLINQEIMFAVSDAHKDGA